jgi:hypothetical protein
MDEISDEGSTGIDQDMSLVNLTGNQNGWSILGDGSRSWPPHESKMSLAVSPDHRKGIPLHRHLSRIAGLSERSLRTLSGLWDR